MLNSLVALRRCPVLTPSCRRHRPPPRRHRCAMTACRCCDSSRRSECVLYHSNVYLQTKRPDAGRLRAFFRPPFCVGRRAVLRDLGLRHRPQHRADVGGGVRAAALAAHLPGVLARRCAGARRANGCSGAEHGRGGRSRARADAAAVRADQLSALQSSGASSTRSFLCRWSARRRLAAGSARAISSAWSGSLAIAVDVLSPPPRARRVPADGRTDLLFLVQPAVHRSGWSSTACICACRTPCARTRCCSRPRSSWGRI